ncbi:MAG: M48 family metallopeptidase [Chloroflexota bacterium]
MNGGSRLSLFGRALLALLLTIGFYSLALAIAFGLLYLIYLEFVVLGRINIRLTVFAFIGAVVILWSIIPRPDRFTPPGPRITRKQFPALFNEIEKVAKLTGQNMPRDIYLVPDVNAFVAERGGFMGIGRKRVMGIGFPLFQLMNVDELKAVLAHEFGHYFGGDTALGPWIYKTREAIIRTTVNVAQTNRWLYIPFEAYAKMFLRVTNAVSRQQEFTADRLAAKTVGAQAVISGLQKVHKFGYAFNVFLQNEYAPVIAAGYKPPMLEGFREFLKSPIVTEAVNNSYQEQLTKGTTNPYDSHPSLKERIAALEGLPAGANGNDHPASSLLPADVDLETLILKQVIREEERFSSLKDIPWENVAETVFTPQWSDNIKPFRQILSEITPASLFDAAQNPSTLFARLASTGKILPPNVKLEQVPQEVQMQVISNIIGMAFAVTLKQNNWKIKTGLGEDLRFVQANKEIAPYRLFPKLAARELSREEWVEYCEKNGLNQFKLE